MLKIYYGHIQLVKDQRVFDKWFEKMNSQRKEKILRCQNDVDKQRSLLAGILLNFGLEKDRFAKQVFYSISHSGNYVICVLSNLAQPDEQGRIAPEAGKTLHGPVKGLLGDFLRQSCVPAQGQDVFVYAEEMLFIDGFKVHARSSPPIIRVTKRGKRFKKPKKEHRRGAATALRRLLYGMRTK